MLQQQKKQQAAAMAMAFLCTPTASLASSAAFRTGVTHCPTASSSATSVAVPLKSSYPDIVCGRGDKRTAKGKRARGSFGNSRPKDASKGTGLAVTPLPPRPKKKDEFEDGEYIHVDIDETLFASS